MARDDRYDPAHPRHRELMLACCPHGEAKPVEITHTTIRKTPGEREWVVRAYTRDAEGLRVRYPEADYYASDVEDAEATAKAMKGEV